MKDNLDAFEVCGRSSGMNAEAKLKRSRARARMNQMFLLSIAEQELLHLYYTIASNSATVRSALLDPVYFNKSKSASPTQPSAFQIFFYSP